MQRVIARWGPWIAIVGLAMIIMAPVTLGDNVLFWGAVSFQFVPWYRAAIASWQAGTLPLWNPWVGGGAPLLANYQVAALYPSTWLMIAVPPERALGWLIALHLMLTGAGMFAWARARGLSRTAALTGALALEGCGYLVTRAGLFPSIVFTFAWMPVWLWRVERLAQHPDHRRAARLAIVTGLGLLAGHAQTAAYGLVLMGTVLLWRGWTASKEVRFRLWAWGCAGFALGAGLAAAQLLPTAAYLRASVRSSGLAEEALIYSFWPWRMLTFFVPDFFGHPAAGDYVAYPTYWENAGYVGLAALLLALGCVIRPSARARGAARFWAIVGGLALVLALGKFLPGYEAAFDALPFLRIFNAPARRMMVTEIALAVLASLAVDYWLDDRPKRWQALPVLVGSVLAVIGGALARAEPPLSTFARATLYTGLILALWGTLVLLRGRVPRPILAAGLLTLLFVDLAVWGAQQIPTTTADFYAACASPTLAEAWRQEPEAGRVLFAGTRVERAEYDLRFGYFRLRDWRPPEGGWTHVCETLLPNLGQLAGVPFADNEDPIRLGHWEQLETLAEAHPRLLPLLGVSHRLDVACATDEVEVAATVDVTLCRVGPAPRAWIVPAARQVAVEALPGALVAEDFAPDAEVLLEVAPAPEIAGGAGAVQRVQDHPNAVTVDFTTDGPAYLVLADAWDAGWTARLDGDAVPVLRADLALRAVPVATAGDHYLVMRYRPQALVWGIVISTLALGAIIFVRLYRR